jgi:CO/xanthine dehydrogenase FAD-binding subunit
MIIGYDRPHSIEEALKLISAEKTHPLGGGTVLTHTPGGPFSVVDLQALKLDTLHSSGIHLEIGATVTLQTLLEFPQTPSALKKCLKLEAPLNLRTMGTVAGALVSSDGRSPLAAVLLALDAKVTVVHRPLHSTPPHLVHELLSLGDLLPVRYELLQGKLITKIEIPLNTKLNYQYVARSPADKPIVSASLSLWPSGRTRLVIGGWGNSPSLAMDGTDKTAIQITARNAAHDATDEWASAEFRSSIAAVLAERCLDGQNE